LPNAFIAAPGRSSTQSGCDPGCAYLAGGLFFLFALAVLHHIKPLEHVAFKVFGLDVFDMYHNVVSAGIAGLCFSVIAFVLVLTATPVPSYLGGIAAERAKLIEERLPAAIKALRLR